MSDSPVSIEFLPEYKLATIHFDSPQKLRDWANAERNTFEPLFIGDHNTPLFRENPQTGRGWRTRWVLDEIMGQCKEWDKGLTAPNATWVNNSIAALRDRVAHYADGRALSAGSSIAKEFLAYREKEGRADVAIGYMAARLGQPPFGRSLEMTGYVEGVLGNKRAATVEKGGLQRIDDAAARSEATATELRQKLDEQTEFAVSVRSEWMGIVEAAKNKAEEEAESNRVMRNDFQELTIGERNAFAASASELMEKTTREIDTFRKAIETEIAMGEPIRFWERKATIHHRWFWVSLLGFIGCAWLLVWQIGSYGKELMAEIEKHQLAVTEVASKVAIPTPPPGPTTTAPATPTPASATQTSAAEGLMGAVSMLHFLRLGILVLAATMGVWLLRFIARILLSSLHLKDDAQERVVMIKSFLALMRAEVKLPAEDVKLALSSIFRPATSGLVKDDGIPPGIWDAVTRLKGGGGA